VAIGLGVATRRFARYEDRIARAMRQVISLEPDAEMGMQHNRGYRLDLNPIETIAGAGLEAARSGAA
jgi:hypothetical protein